MKIPLFITNALKKSDTIPLTVEQSRYCLTVLRLKLNDVIYLFNGKDGEFKAILSAINKKDIHVEIIDQVKPFAPLKKLILVFSPIKQDRLNFMIEKATELGVTHFKPIITEYTQVHKINEDRLLKIAIEAAEQCERQCIPVFLKPEKLRDFIKNHHQELEPIAFAYEALAHKTDHLNAIIKNLQGVIIGPEGGFSESEATFLSSHIPSICLGSTILRAETAAIVALDRVRSH